jgi:hypothetical protein
MDANLALSICEGTVFFAVLVVLGEYFADAEFARYS